MKRKTSIVLIGLTIVGLLSILSCGRIDSPSMYSITGIKMEAVEGDGQGKQYFLPFKIEKTDKQEEHVAGDTIRHGCEGDCVSYVQTEYSNSESDPGSMVTICGVEIEGEYPAHRICLDIDCEEDEVCSYFLFKGILTVVIESNIIDPNIFQTEARMDLWQFPEVIHDLESILQIPLVQPKELARKMTAG